MSRPTYDERRAAAVPCAGGCPVLVTHPTLGRYLCHECRKAEWVRGWAELQRGGQPDAHGGLE